MSDHDNTSQTPASPEPTTPATTEHASAPTKPRRKRGLWVAGGVVAAALLAGGGVAAGAALADLDDDDDEHVASSSPDDERARVTDRDSDDPDDAGSSDSATGVTAYGSDAAADIADIAAAASTAADGDVVSIDAERDGTWEVQLDTATGDESEVRVARDGSAELVATEAADEHDRAPEHVLDAEAISSLVEAALADTEGTIIELGSDDGRTPYDVTVLTGDGRTVELDVTADFAIVSRDTDD